MNDNAGLKPGESMRYAIPGMNAGGTEGRWQG